MSTDSPADSHQELAAAEELHRQANAAAEALPSSLGLPNEAEARAFASQVGVCSQRAGMPGACPSVC